MVGFSSRKISIKRWNCGQRDASKRASIELVSLKMMKKQEKMKTSEGTRAIATSSTVCHFYHILPHFVTLVFLSSTFFCTCVLTDARRLQNRCYCCCYVTADVIAMTAFNENCRELKNLPFMDCRFLSLTSSFSCKGGFVKLWHKSSSFVIQQLHCCLHCTGSLLSFDIS